MQSESIAPIAESTTLFALGEPTPPEARQREEFIAPLDPKRGARFLEADRSQMSWGRIDLDAQLPEDHPARAIWGVVARLELTSLYAQIEARGEVAGRSAIDPKILLALWIYGTSEGEGNGREIWRLTEVHSAYRWICGGVDVGYHTLTDFRSEQGEAFDELITQVLALLMKQELVDLSRVAQDGKPGARERGSEFVPGASRRSKRSCKRLARTWKR